MSHAFTKTSHSYCVEAMRVPSRFIVAAMVERGVLFKVQHSLKQCRDASLVTHSCSPFSRSRTEHDFAPEDGKAPPSSRCSSRLATFTAAGVDMDSSAKAAKVVVEWSSVASCFCRSTWPTVASSQESVAR